MWIRKSQYEIAEERQRRRAKFGQVVLFVVFSSLVLVYYHFGSIAGFLRAIEQNPESAFGMAFLPLLLYIGYRNYVLFGGVISDETGMMCLACNQGMGYGDDGWGFKVYGKKRQRWYQIRACKTPERCDIVYRWEVRWIPEKERN